MKKIIMILVLSFTVLTLSIKNDAYAIINEYDLSIKGYAELETSPYMVSLDYQVYSNGLSTLEWVLDYNYNDNDYGSINVDINEYILNTYDFKQINSISIAEWTDGYETNIKYNTNYDGLDLYNQVIIFRYTMSNNDNIYIPYVLKRAYYDVNNDVIDVAWLYVEGLGTPSFTMITNFTYLIENISRYGNYDSYNRGYNDGLEDGHEQGYSIGKIEGHNSGKIEGFNEAEIYYGYDLEGTYITAQQYGTIRYNEGYEKGLNAEIDWFNWAFTFITMPVRILNVEVLPNIKIGYFALFTLMTGIISWFFFIVGKGGGRKK